MLSGQNHKANKSQTLSAVKAWLQLVTEDKKLFLIFLVYSVVITLFYLAIPVTAQILVNIVITGVLLQPFIVFSVGTLIAFILLAAMRTAQFHIVEIIQRKILVDISQKISEKIYFAKISKFSNIYAPELVNRFFEIMNIQKSSAMLLLEIPSAVLQIIAGLILIAVYSKILLAFDVVFMLILFSIYWIGRGAVKTSYEESSSKYSIAFWLEEIARCLISIKFHGSKKHLMEKTTFLVNDYLDKRNQHFQILIKQFSTNLLIQAVASAGVLGIGGYLVMTNVLSLGQLIAAEIVIVMIISALDKIAQKFETWYDLLTSITKVGHLTDLDIEDFSGIDVPVFAQGAKIKCRSLHFAYDSNPDKEVLHDINLEISPGTRASLVGISGSGKTSFAYLISRIHKNTSGEIYFNDILIQQFNPDLLRQQIAFVGNFGEIFTGSIRENILIGRENVSENHLNEVVDLVELRRDLNRFEQGLESELLSEGRNISLGQRQRILLARALVGKPQLLILDEAFSGMDEMTKLKVIDKLFDSAKPWTILNISHDPEVVVKTNHIFLLEDGRIIEAGLLDQLRASPGSEFIRLFPKLIL